MPTNTLTAEKDEDWEEKQIYTVALNGDELHHLKMISLMHLEENTSTRQILQETLTDQQAVMKTVYDKANSVQNHRKNRDGICKYDTTKMWVSGKAVTAIITSLEAYPEEEWSFVQEAWQRSVRRLVDQVGGERSNV